MVLQLQLCLPAVVRARIAAAAATAVAVSVTFRCRLAAALVRMPAAAGGAATAAGPAAAGRAAAVPKIAAPPRGLTTTAIGNMSSNHASTLLPDSWEGNPNLFNENTAADQDVVRLLAPFGNSGEPLEKFAEFKWNVGMGPLFLHGTTNLIWPLSRS